MPTRLLLTRDAVDEAVEPERGEIWLADTRLPGFGLRVWRNRSGDAGKAFAVRVRDQSGTFKRRTLNYWDLLREHHWLWRLEREERLPSLGEMVTEARVWARDEIDTLRGQLSLEDEETEQRARAHRRIGQLTLSNVAVSVLEGMKARGLSQAYRDRLDKLFALNVPKDIQDRSILNVSTEQIKRVLENKALSHQNARILRPFLSNLVDQPARAGVRSRTNSYRLREIRLAEKASASKRPDLARRRSNWFDDVVRRLDGEQVYWQQALCLRLYLTFRAPLKTLMSARWDQTFDEKFDPTPYSKGHTRRVWAFGEGPWKRQYISVAENTALMNLLRRGEQEFPGSPFWFPARHGRAAGHIRSVNHVWGNLLHDLNVTYLSPRQFKIFYDRAAFGRSIWTPNFYYEPEWGPPNA